MTTTLVRQHHRSDLRLTMIFENIHTGTRIVRCMDLDSRLEDINLKIEKPFLTDFDGMVMAMKARENRRGIIERFAGSFAEFLDDKDGWHGARRQATTEATS
jgi:hypothetical protein